MKNAKMNWTLRPAHPDDLEAAQSLLRSCGLPTELLVEQFGEAYVVAEMGRDLVGVGGVERYGSYGLLRSVAVAAHLRGSGIGAALVADRLAWVERSGLTSLFLLTMEAERYFAHHGFVRIERSAAPAEIRASSQFTDLCPATAVLMKLDGFPRRV
jgi:amino-acid N-acetyltransferase